MEFANNIIGILIAYLLGTLPTGYIVGKQVKKIDIREHGSGNVGATNVFRTVGKGWGVAVLLIDALKGWLATAVIATTAQAFPDLAMPMKQIVFGGAAIAGHTWTPWLGLKGGKGVACAAGALLGIFPAAIAACVAIWAVVFAIWRYVSLASIVAAACFPILLLVFYAKSPSFGGTFMISLLLAGLVIYNHKSNMTRLKEGKELKIEFGKSTSDSNTDSGTDSKNTD